MTTLKLYNTKTRSKEVFQPIDPENVRMYVCGPTVYDRAHLGNARPVIVFDVLYRLLRHVYGAEHVTYVRNFTDVDDKINARAAESGRAIGEITAETTQWFLDDMAAVGALEPTAMPRATQYIAQMVEMISGLIAKGHAYEAEGHVLFAVESYAEYGALSGRSVDDMIAGARVEVAPYKRNPMDFVLWKPSSEDLPGWDSPWGRGRPGWHIECSAMARDLLGERFDIHGGGIDLQFPHHENEIAQSRCAGHGFANVWMHNEMLQVEGKKMSKSLGNFFTVREVLDGLAIAHENFNTRMSVRMSGEEIRAAFLLSHYRSVMDLGVQRRHEAGVVVKEFARGLGRGGLASLHLLEETEALPEVLSALKDDLDTPRAIAAIRKHLKALPADPDARVAELAQNYSSQLLLGFDLKASVTAEDAARATDERRGVFTKAFGTVDAVQLLVDQLDQARAEKNFEEADRLRSGLVDAGVIVKNTPSGTKWERQSNFDPGKLEALK
ncbi:cysteine--tRNA ligase [uncultured Roseobacter sp.]|uniref:cysteine--tRNA ligase n=1 Tax=uncultured Roseobacter sp. TaxID=114847 RepID=UPI00262A0696|nr:cysteine--tRNA ligase [uncultured Roseobacter sp.]